MTCNSTDRKSAQIFFVLSHLYIIQRKFKNKVGTLEPKILVVFCRLVIFGLLIIYFDSQWTTIMKIRETG